MHVDLSALILNLFKNTPEKTEFERNIQGILYLYNKTLIRNEQYDIK